MSIKHEQANAEAEACALEAVQMVFEFVARYGATATLNGFMISLAGIAYANGAAAQDFAGLALHQFAHIAQEAGKKES